MHVFVRVRVSLRSRTCVCILYIYTRVRALASLCERARACMPAVRVREISTKAPFLCGHVVC